MSSFLSNSNLANFAFNWLLFMIDLTLKGSIVLVTAFLISKICVKAPFQFHHLIIFLGLGSFAVLPAIYQLDAILFFTHPALELTFEQTSPVFIPGILEKLLHILVLLAPWLLLVWLTGFLSKIAGIVMSIFEIRQLKRRAQIINHTSWNKLLKTLLLKEKIARKIEIRQSNYYPAPITCGFLNAVIIIPGDSRNWTQEQQQVVLLHELSHIRRYDNLLLIIALLIAAVFWFNPLVWNAIRLLRQNREGACDDYVINAGFKPSDYAGHLLDIIQACHNNHSDSAPYLKTATVAKARILNILDTSRITRMLSPKAFILSILMGVVFILPFAAINPVTANEKFSPVNITRQISSGSQINHARTELPEKTPTIRSSKSHSLHESVKRYPKKGRTPNPQSQSLMVH